MFDQAFELKNGASTVARRLMGLVPFVAVLAAPASSQAQEAVVAGDTGSIQVLVDAGVINPTSVAVRDGVAFVTESQIGRIGQIGGVFKVVTVALDGTGLLNNVIQLPGNDFFPEGISLDPVTNDLFVGSALNGTLVKVPSGTFTAQVFAQPAPAVLTRAALGNKVDNVNNLLWVCDSNVADPNLPGGTLTGISLADASVVVTHALPGATDVCNDVALDAAGNIFVTESSVGQVFRVDAANALTADSLQLLVASPGIAANGGVGANGLALTGGALFVANTTAGTIVRFDPAAADVAASEAIVNVTEGDVANTLLSGPDGLLAISDTEILVAENGLFGGGQNRLVKLTLDPVAQ
jgi:sugar lactone lactonase YvrE